MFTHSGDKLHGGSADPTHDFPLPLCQCLGLGYGLKTDVFAGLFFLEVPMKSILS